MINCAKLHDIVRRGVRYRFNPAYDGTKNSNLFVLTGKENDSNYTAKIPLNGVYIMFENNELGHNGERIVRIGINSQQDRLPQRIKTHFTGTTRRSIFRKHIGSCLKNVSAESLENEISTYIRNNISFVIIEVNDKTQRENLEKELITTVSNCSDCTCSSVWLGKYCKSDKIKNGKLWNVTFLNISTPLFEEHTQLLYDGLVLSNDLSQAFNKFLKD